MHRLARHSLRMALIGLLSSGSALICCGDSAKPPEFAPVSVANASTKALQIVGPNLYVAAWGNGLQILDISQPAQPKWKGGWNPRQCPVAVQVIGDFAYVANRRAGLSVLAVRDPAQPILVGEVDISGDAMAVQVAGRYAYVANYPKGFSVVDVQQPAQPALVATVALPQAATSIQAAGDYLYLTEPNGLHIFSLQDPKNPTRGGEQRLFGPAPRVQIVGDLAYVATAQSGLITLGLGDPTAPAFLDQLMLQPNMLPVLVREGPTHTRFVGPFWMTTNAAWRAEMERRHGTNLPQNVAEVVAAVRNSSHYHQHTGGRRGLNRSLTGLHVTGPYALALAYRDALEVIDVTAPEAPWLVGRIQLTGPTWDVRGANGYAYVMDTGANIHVVDLREPQRPTQVTQFLARNYVSRVLAVTEAEAPPPVAIEYPDASLVTQAPELSDPRWESNGSFSFNLTGLGGGRYVIEASGDLRAWTNFSANTLPAEGSLRIGDSNVVKSAQKFYRARFSP
jgi:hypothetical protein